MKMSTILVFLALAAGAHARTLANGISAGDDYILADRGETCCPGAEISSPGTCKSAYEKLDAKLSFKYPNKRGIVAGQGGFPAVPTGCSLQYECGRYGGMWEDHMTAPCYADQNKDMTPHWSGAAHSTNYRTPEFRAICKATPDCNKGASCKGDYVLADGGVVCTKGEELSNQKQCKSAYEQLNGKLNFPHPNVRTIHTNMDGWASGVPAACSLQYEGSYVNHWSDMTPHWSGASVPTTARMPEFRAICCKASLAPVTPKKKEATINKMSTASPAAPRSGCAIKDGFLTVTCVKDYMYYRGDRFGDNRHDYKLGPVSNVSIVHYKEEDKGGVAKEDRKEMTPKVCFEYCRTVPGMGFFGIVNGRGCYCAPYFKPMESDSSMCDSVCEGDTTLMCGGVSKSSIWAMHCCANTKDELQTATDTAASLKAVLDNDAEAAETLGQGLQDSGEKLQKWFGAVGDSGAASHAQAAKVFAGELVHTAEAAVKISTELAELNKRAHALLLTDVADLEQIRKAEGLLESFDAAVADGEAASDKLTEVIALAENTETEKDASKQYYPIMYFVDKEFTDVPSTCAGDMVGEPVQGDEDACATKCDENIHSCVGYQFFARSSGFDTGRCILLSKFSSAIYYTGCGSTNSTKFLQTDRQTSAPFEAKCVAKLSKFQGTTLKPDGSGKCKSCLKKLTKADRCY